jgi:hypothetical protein
MPTYAELLAQKRAATSGGVKGTPQPAQKTGAKTYAQMLDERRGIKPVVAKKTAAPAVKEPIMSVAPKKTQPAAPIMSVAPKKEAATFSSVPKEQKELIAEPAKKTITQRIGDTVKKGLGMLSSVNLPSAIAGQASKMAASAAVKDPKVTAEKAGNVALRTGTALASSTTSALRFAQEKIQSNPTVLRDPVTNFILKKAGGEAIDKKLTQLSQWAAQYDPTGPMLKKADESLQAYSKRISPVTESYERASLKEKLTTRLGETLYNYLPETAGAMVPYLLQPEVGALMMFGDTANRIKQDALVNGVDPKTAEQTAVRAAAGIAVLDRLGVGKIAPGVKSKITQALIKNTGKLWSVVKEPFTEAAQEMIQIMAERTFKDVGLSEEQERLLMSGFLGIFFDQGMRGAGLAKSALETRQMPENFDKVDSNTQSEFMSAVSAVQKEQALGEVSPQTMARFVAVANQVDETIVAAKTDEVRAEVINEAINSPISEDTTALTEEIGQDPDMRLAFGQAMVDLNDANDPALEETTQKQGLVFLRVNNPNDPILKGFENLPAFYDPSSGRIVFNEAVIAKTLKHLADGKVLVIGDGKLTTSFAMKEGESLADLKTRYESELIKHEMAHVKTITQEDINLFEKLQAEGKTAEANRLRINLEERANKYTVLNAKKELDSDTADLISKVVSREQSRAETSQQLALDAFPRTEKESAYQSWKKMVSRETDLKNANFDEIQEYLGSKTANQRFEDALDRQDVVGGDYVFDELISTFQKRYSKETAAKASKTSAAESGKAVAEAFKKMPDRVKVAIRRELKAAREAGAVDSAALTKKITDRVLKAEQRHIERGPMRRRLKAIERTRVMKSIRKLARRARDLRTESGNRKSKISVEAQRIMNGSKKDGILGIVKGLSMKRNVVMAKATQEMIDWRAAHPEAIELPENIALNMQIAKTAGISQQTIRELKETEAFMTEVIEKGTAERLSDLARIKEQNSRFVDSVKEHLTGDANYESETLVRIDDKEKPALATGRGMFWGSAPVGDFARRLGKQAERLFADTVSGSETTKAHVNRTWQKVEKMAEEVYGSKKNYIQNVKNEGSVQVNLGTFKNGAGKTKPLVLSKLQAMSIYVGLKDAKYKQNLLDPAGNAFTPEMLAAADTLLTAQDKEYITNVVKIAYAGQYKRFAEAVQRSSGVDLGFTENYAGSIRYVSAPQEDVENPAVDLINSTLQKQVTGIKNAATKGRTNFVGEMKISENPIFDAIQYVASTEHYINMVDKIGKWEALLKDDNTKEAIKKKVGKEFLFLLEQHIEDIRSGGLTSQEVDKTNKQLDKLMGNISGALLASPGVWAGQMPSILQFKAEAGPGPGFADGIAKYKELLPILKKYAPSVDARIMESADQVLAEISENPSMIGKILNKWRKIQGMPIDFVDKITTLAGTLGMFEVKTRKYMKQGLTQEQAYRAAGRDVNLAIVNTQSTKSQLGKSYWEKRNNALRLITGLRNQPNKMARATFAAIGKLKRGEITPAEFIHFQVYASILQPLAYTAVRYATKQGIRAAKIALLKMAGGAAATAIAKGLQDAQDEDEEQFATSLLAGTASQALGFFAIGDMVNILMANRFQGKNYEYRPAVVSAVVDDVLDMLKAATSDTAVNKTQTVMVKGSRALTRLFGVGDPAGLFQLLEAAVKENTKKIKASVEYKREQKVKKAEKAKADKAKKAS